LGPGFWTFFFAMVLAFVISFVLTLIFGINEEEYNKKNVKEIG